MKYVIYEQSEPNILRTVERDGYDIKTKQCITLQEVECDVWMFETHHDSHESAVLEIEKYKDHLKNKILVILPVFQINYEGKIL